jgi:protease-4
LILILSVTVIISFSLSRANAQRVPFPEGVFSYKSASNTFGFESAWINPAGLGRFTGNGIMLMADYFDGNIAKSWGALVNGEQSAFAYRRLDNPLGEDYQEWLLASGIGLGKLKVGGSYRYFKDGPAPYDNRHYWNIGLQLQGDYKLSGAIVFANLNRGRVHGERSEVEHRYSISYRPFDFDLTLSADMLRTSSIDIGDAHLIYSLSMSPHPGLTIEGLLDSDENFNLGIRANLLKYFVGNESRFNKHGGGRGTTIYAGTTDVRQESLVPWYNRRLTIDVPEVLAENPPKPVFGKKSRSLYSVISSIYRAADDPSIKELIFKLRQPTVGFAQAQEIRDALKYFREKGKTVICHLSMPNNLGYYIAAASDSILIPPVSQLNLIGLKAELTFYGSTMAKIGVEADIVKIGAYKTAAETLTREESSAENKEQINRLLDNIYEQFLNGIAEGRDISADSVKKIIDNGPFTSSDALNYGLVDGLTYADDVSNGFLNSLPEISLNIYEKDTLLNDGWPSKPEIAVVVAAGEISYSEGGILPWQGRDFASPEGLKRAFSQAEKNRKVKAIVFRVNSPGGLALASEEILHTSRQTAEKVPLVVSMSDLAASGGYFISMAGEKLFAQSGTLTGSIGIFGGKVSLEKLHEKIELGKELYTRGRFAGMASTVRPFTDDERKKQEEQIGAFYRHFTDLVSDNRKINRDSVELLAQGKVWTGYEALQNGLVDEVGGLKQAIDYVAKSKDLKDYRIVFYPEKRPLFVLPKNTFINALLSIFGIVDGSAAVKEVTETVADDGLFTRLPFDISIE